MQFIISFNKSGPPNPDGVLIMRADGSTVLSFWQDNTGEYASLNGKRVWKAGSCSGSHRVVLTKENNKSTLTVDNAVVGSDNLGAPPAIVQLGGNLQHDTREWNNFDLQSFSVKPN